jgi:GntR family transcriptional regulator, transcriptional repressor for pyruvate dehydrogenase complex
MFRPVKTKKVYEEIIEQVKLLITEGRLQPGDKLLSERELAEKLKVSRASVREAFSALEMMGIIKIKPGEGSFVRQVSFDNLIEPLSFMLQLETDDMFELLEVRKILEVSAAGMAAHRATKDDLDALTKALDEMQQDVLRGDLGDTADADFHYAVLNSAHNTILNRIMHTVEDLMIINLRNSRQRMFNSPGMPQILLGMHQNIYQAISDGDAKMARHYMQQHLALVAKEMSKYRNKTIRSKNY